MADMGDFGAKLLDRLRGMFPLVEPYEDNLPQGADRRRRPATGPTEAAIAAVEPQGERLRFPVRGALDEFSGNSNMSGDDMVAPRQRPYRVGVERPGVFSEFEGVDNMPPDEAPQPAPVRMARGAARDEDTELRGGAMRQFAERAAFPAEREERGALDPKRTGMKEWTEYYPENQDEADAIDEVKRASESGQTKSVKVKNPGAGGALDAPEWPMPARKSLSDAFRKRVEETEAKIGRDLSPQEKGQLQLDFFLRLMAASDERGASFFGNVGKAGLGTQAQYKDVLERKRRDRREGRDDAFREITLEDKDQDNIRADRREVREERRDNERMKIAREQFDRGKYRVEKSTNGLVLIDANGNARIIKDENGKPLMPAEHTSAQKQFWDWVMEDPDRWDKYMQARGKDPDTNDEAAVRKKLDDFAAKVYGDPTIRPAERERTIKEYGDFLRGQRGGQPSGPQRFNTPAELDAAIKSGKVKKGDRVITPQGERIVK